MDGIKVTCACGRVLTAPASQAGKKGKCPSCGAHFVIPSLNQTAPAPSLDTPLPQPETAAPAPASRKPFPTKQVAVGGTALVLVAGIVITAFFLFASYGSKELNAWCEKIELKNAKTLGSIYEDYLVALESHNGPKVWNMMTTGAHDKAKNPLAEWSAVKGIGDVKTEMEREMEHWKDELKSAKGGDVEKLKNKIAVLEKAIRNLDALTKMSAREFWIWVIENDPTIDDQLKKMLMDDGFSIVGEEISGDEGRILARRKGTSDTYVYMRFKKEDGKWRIDDDPVHFMH